MESDSLTKEWETEPACVRLDFSSGDFFATLFGSPASRLIGIPIFIKTCVVSLDYPLGTLGAFALINAIWTLEIVDPQPSTKTLFRDGVLVADCNHIHTLVLSPEVEYGLEVLSTLVLACGFDSAFSHRLLLGWLVLFFVKFAVLQKIKFALWTQLVISVPLSRNLDCGECGVPNLPYCISTEKEADAEHRSTKVNKHLGYDYEYVLDFVHDLIC